MKSNKKVLSGIFYALIGLDSGLALLLLYDFLLSKTSSITTLILNTKYDAFYLWFYAISTFLALLLFGVDVVLSVYLIRRTTLVKGKEQGGTVLGTIVGAFAASCPICSGFLLALVGISGGLAAFPFKGLELKTLSVVLLVLPLIFLIRRIRNPHFDGRCPVLKNPKLTKKDTPLFISLVALLAAELILSYSLLKNEPVVTNLFDRNRAYLISHTDATHNTKAAKLIQEEVTPSNGLKTPIILGDVIPKMVSLGIIDTKKLEDEYKQNGGIPQDIKDLLTKPSKTPLVITSKNQFFLVTLLWPLGLSNKMDINKESPVAGKDVNNFASTGGWTLGKDQNGGDYFNKYDLIPLKPSQEQRVKRLAESIYRPCCNNSTFFQDCNHGSAALGLIELGVSQGLSDQDIYRTILSFNSFWFPQNYTEIAYFFQSAKYTNWNDVDPQLALSKTYSSISGWQLVDASVSKIPGLIPQTQGGGSCGA